MNDPKCDGCGYLFQVGDRAYEVEMRDIKVSGNKATITHPKKIFCQTCVAK